MTVPLRIVVAEDSPTVRALLVAMFESEPGLRVVGEARSGREAIELATELRPDVLTMDIEMPEMNGLEATRAIMQRAPVPIVIISATANSRETSLSLDATEAGALAVLGKPGAPGTAGFEAQRDQTVSTVKAMAQVKVVRRWQARPARPTPSRLAEFEVPTPSPRVLAMAASTGGPAVFHQIINALPAGYPVPVLVVQHIASGFTEAFAEWLDSGSRVRVKLAAAGEPATGGTVYVAPEAQHMGLDAEGRIVLDPSGPIGGFAPSATYLFTSVAGSAGAACTAVILTGMGSDGVDGLRHVRSAGGCVLAQDEETSIVFGMPGEAIRAGLASAVLGTPAIIERLLVHANGGVHAGKDSRR